jgi:hypothetical protein
MLVKIALVVSLCAQVPAGDIAKRKAELEARNPGAKVSVRVDTKCLKAK